MTRVAILDYVINRVVKLLFAETLSTETHIKRQVYNVFSDMIKQDMERKLNIADKAIRPFVAKVKEKVNIQTKPEERVQIREELYTAAKQALVDAGVSPDLAELLAHRYDGADSLLATYGPNFQRGSEYNTKVRNSAFAKMSDLDQMLDTVVSSRGDAQTQAWDKLMRTFISAAELSLDQYPTIPKQQDRKPRSEKVQSQIWAQYEMVSRGLKMLLNSNKVKQSELDAFMKDYLTEAGLGITDEKEIIKTILKGVQSYLSGKVPEGALTEILDAFDAKLKGIHSTEVDSEKLLHDIAAQVLLNPSEENVKSLLSMHMSKLEKAPELLVKLRKVLVPVGSPGESARALAKGGWSSKLVQHLNNMYIIQLKKFLEMPSTQEMLTPAIKQSIGLTPEVEKMLLQPWSNLKYEYEVSRDMEKELAKSRPDMTMDEKESLINKQLQSQTLLDHAASAAQTLLQKIRTLPNTDSFKRAFMSYVGSYIQEPAFMKDLLVPDQFNKDLARLTKKQRAERGVKPIGSKDAPIREGESATMEDLLSSTTGEGPEGGLSRIPLTNKPKDLAALVSQTITDQTGYDMTKIAPVINRAVANALSVAKDSGEELTIGSFLYGGLASDLLNAFEKAKLPITDAGVEAILNAVESGLKKQIFKEHGLGEKAISAITGAVRKAIMRAPGVSDEVKADISSLVREFVYNGEEGAKEYLTSKGLRDADEQQKIIDHYLIPARSLFTQRSLAERKLFKPQGR